MGYSRAGFDVTGVDLKPQKRYPFEFIQEDAIEYLEEHGHEYDAIHASPPCQAYSTITRVWKGKAESHPKLIIPVRQQLIHLGIPYIIENVEGARRDLIDPIMLCGTMFGLQTDEGNQLLRHRYFECSFSNLVLVPNCQHNGGSAIGVYGGGQNPSRKRAVSVYGSTGGSSNRDKTNGFNVEQRKKAMGIDWLANKELCQAIPPAYTEFLGKFLVRHLEEAAK